MGLLKHLLFWPVTGPTFLTRFSLEKVRDTVREELTDDQAVKEELLALQMMLELGEIGDEEYVSLEAALMARLRDVRHWREEFGMATRGGLVKVAEDNEKLEEDEVQKPEERERGDERQGEETHGQGRGAGPESLVPERRSAPSPRPDPGAAGVPRDGRESMGYRARAGAATQVSKGPRADRGGGGPPGWRPAAAGSWASSTTTVTCSTSRTPCANSTSSRSRSISSLISTARRWPNRSG